MKKFQDLLQVFHYIRILVPDRLLYKIYQILSQFNFPAHHNLNKTSLNNVDIILQQIKVESQIQI